MIFFTFCHKTIISSLVRPLSYHVGTFLLCWLLADLFEFSYHRFVAIPLFLCFFFLYFLCLCWLHTSLSSHIIGLLQFLSIFVLLGKECSEKMLKGVFLTIQINWPHAWMATFISLQTIYNYHERITMTNLNRGLWSVERLKLVIDGRCKEVLASAYRLNFLQLKHNLDKYKYKQWHKIKSKYAFIVYSKFAHLCKGCSDLTILQFF